jgi:hypothetical protein
MRTDKIGPRRKVAELIAYMENAWSYCGGHLKDRCGQPKDISSDDDMF